MAYKWLRKSGPVVPAPAQVFAVISKMLEQTWDTRFRSCATDFTRGGPLTPELIMTLLLFMAGDANRRGYGQLLDEFWDQATGMGIRLPVAEPVSAAAFCVARRKLSPTLFDSLLLQVDASFQADHRTTSLWHGRRVYAVDGSKFNLQRSAELAATFGVPSGAHCPQALVNTLFDVIARQPVALTVAPTASCERKPMLQLSKHLKPGDILVLDRGYPSIEVLRELTEAQIDVLVRVPRRSSFQAVQVFQDSGGADYRVLVQPAHGDIPPLELRALRFDVGGDQDWFLLTALRRAAFTASQVKELYHLRWEIEEFLKLLKSDFFSQRQFHAKTALGVEQEIRAQMLFVAISRLLMATAAQPDDGIPYLDLSPKSAILGYASHLVCLMLCEDPDHAEDNLHRLLHRLRRVRDRRRPARAFPRRSFKPTPKWNARGRSGG